MKASAHASKTKGLAPRTTLFIEVRQAGIVQTELALTADSKRREIVFGSRRGNDLWVELANVPDALKVFFCENGKFGVLLEPRIDGFVNTGSEFGSVNEFLKPQGALAKLAAIAEPYRVKLDLGARGVLKVGDFDILFKVEIPRPVIHRSFVTDGAARKFMDPVQEESGGEQMAKYLAFAFASLIFIPMTVWLLKAPLVIPTSLSQMPPQFLEQFVHPDHYRLLPKIYGKDYTPENSVALATEWVTQLQARWNAQDSGHRFQATVPILKDFEPSNRSLVISREWKTAVAQAHAELEAKRTAKDSPRYYQFQKPYPVLAVATAGSERGSLYVRQINRIHAMDASYAAMRTLISHEQKFLEEFYTERGMTTEGMFSAPHQTGRRLDEETQVFEAERARYAAAEGWAQRAGQSEFFRIRSETREEHGTAPRAPRTTLRLEKTGLLAPTFALVQNSERDLSSGEGRPRDDAYENALSNALYSRGVLDIPPPPPPQAVLNRAEVDALLVDRREEIRGCYEDALRAQSALEGTLKVAWWIETNGKARDIQQGTSTLKHDRLMSCLKNLILSWNFPKPRHGAVRVEYPFRFVIEK